MRRLMWIFALGTTVSACEELGQQSVPDFTTAPETVVGPCPGYRHDALLEDDEGTLWVGCGTDLGLYRSTDLAFSSFESVPAFDQYRVYGLTLNNGAIYAAGGRSGGGSILERFTNPSSPQTLVEYSGGAPFMRISNSENIAITTDGRMMLDSLTGNYIAYEDGDGWTEAYYWNEGDLDEQPEGFQMSAITTFKKNFYAVGSTIAQPPMVFLPSTDERATYHFETVTLNVAASGALTGIAARGPDSFVVVGVDEDSNRGVLATCDSNCREPNSWSSINLNALDEHNGRLHALHMRGEVGCAVGEHFPQSEGGLALVTVDGGESWSKLPGDMALLSDCHVLADNRIVVAGDLSYLAVFGD